MVSHPLNNFDDKICAEFERFLTELEALDPPSEEWIKAQRQKVVIQPEWSLEEISAAYEASIKQMIGNALQHIVGDHGLQLPDGWRNDFAFNFDIIQRQLVDLYELGTWPAPGYSERIGILLRRAKRRDLSDRFETAWLRIVI